jgi:hypothetical protein
VAGDGVDEDVGVDVVDGEAGVDGNGGPNGDVGVNAEGTEDVPASVGPGWEPGPALVSVV